MTSLVPTEYLNRQNVHGGSFTTDQTGGVANSGNTQYGEVGGSPAGLRGAGVYSISGGNGSPSATQTPLSDSYGMMKGGGKRRKHSGKRSRKHKRSRSSKKYARKHSTKYRIKHRRSRRHSHSKKVRYSKKAQSGGYQQYMGNTPFTLAYRTPGFSVSSNMSALANPAPFMPYNSLTGGSDTI
jgi:hypothetical protein